VTPVEVTIVNSQDPRLAPEARGSGGKQNETSPPIAPTSIAFIAKLLDSHAVVSRRAQAGFKEQGRALKRFGLEGEEASLYPQAEAGRSLGPKTLRTSAGAPRPPSALLALD